MEEYTKMFIENTSFYNEIVLPKKLCILLPHFLSSWLRTTLCAFVIYPTASFFCLDFWKRYVSSSKDGYVETMPSKRAMVSQVVGALISIPINTLFSTVFEWMIENGWTRCYPRISDVGWQSYVLHTLTYLFAVEFGIYWAHRLLHEIKPIYKYIHAPHHHYSKEIAKLVPSVQELAKDFPKKIPKRYIRNDQDHPIILADDDENLRLPTINMEALISGNGVELEKLHSACQEWGFFQLINHGISSSLLENFKKETQEFFNLPLKEKKIFWQSPTDAEGFGQAFVKSDDQKLDWADMFYLTTLPKYLRRPHLFPMLPLPFRETLENYSAEVDKLSRKILDYMAKALNIDNGTNVFGEIFQAIRMNYYPPCSQPEKVIGIVPHTDATALITVLLQLNEIEGLQINKDNKWVAVNPPPDAFVVNIGDILEIMSNGIYRSVMHRAVVNATKERLSVATFVSPSLDREICPNPKLINSTNLAKYNRINMNDYWKGFVDRPLDGRRYLDGVRIVDDDA